MKNILVGVSGGSCSGKTTFSKLLAQKFPKEEASIIFQDSYYIDQSDKFDKDGGRVNFDHVKAIDWDLFYHDLQKASKGIEINIPIYEFSTHKRLDKTISYTPTSIIIVDGTLIYHRKKMRDLFNIKIFLDASTDVRYQRRLRRDTEERGRTPEGVEKQFFKQVEPMNLKYVVPTMNYAEFVFNGENITSERADFIANTIKKINK